MPTPAGIIDTVAALQNDAAKTRYTYEACLPYLNLAMQELQEIFEENNIPVTNEESAYLIIPVGEMTVAFQGTVVTLPADLIEIQQIWETQDASGMGFVSMTKKDFIPPYLQVPPSATSYFGIWAWVDNSIKLPLATGPIVLKLQYIKSLFQLPIVIEDIDVPLDGKFTNITTYLEYATGALCSQFVGVNETRALALLGKADAALERSLNIPTKGRQAIMTRRRPFRAAYKMRGWM